MKRRNLFKIDFSTPATKLPPLEMTEMYGKFYVTFAVIGTLKQQDWCALLKQAIWKWLRDMRAKKSAFTLVELLVVISIIAMLMGILMPALAAAKRSAYKTACKQNLHGCTVAFSMYLNDNRDIMPTIGNVPSEHLNDEPSITAVLGKYLSGPDALKCPADPQAQRFRKDGSSYEYNTYPPPFPEGPFNNQSRRIMGKGITMTRNGQEVTIPWAEIFVLRDYEDFHGKAGKAGSRMYFYADNLVADIKRNK